MSTAALERALALPLEERAPALLALAEDQWFDRKSARISPRDLAGAEIGLANAEGGVIVVGLSAGQVDGLGGDRRRLSSLQQAAIDFTVPPVTARARLVACVNERGAEDELLVVEVETGTLVHENVKGEVFLRVGDENRRLSFEQVQELRFDKGQAAYEAAPVRGASPDELDDELLGAYAVEEQHPEPARLLMARGLIGRDGALTNGAILLFGRHPQDRYPEAVLRVLRYRGVARGTGSRQQLLADVRCEGPILRLLPQAIEVVQGLVPTRRALGADGRFGPVGLVPRDAWLEAVVNAVVHRSYSVHGDHIRVEIFDDRLEVESPGRFPGLVNLSDPRAVSRFARNPRIARVCADLRFGQELGEGIRRMFEEMRLAGLADPVYRQTSGSVRVTLSSTPVDRELEERLPEGARGVLRAIREAGRLSTGEVAHAIGVSRPVAIRRLRALQNDGLVQWVGNSPRDPRAYWRLPA